MIKYGGLILTKLKLKKEKQISQNVIKCMNLCVNVFVVFLVICRIQKITFDQTNCFHHK